MYGFAWVVFGFGCLCVPVSLVEAWPAVLAGVGDVVWDVVAGFGGVDPASVADDVVAVASGASAVCV